MTSQAELAAPFDATTQREVQALAQCWSAGDLPHTLALSQRLSQRLPDYYFGWKMLGLAWHKLGDLSQAASAFERAIELRPSDAALLYNHGCLLWSLKLFHQALAQTQALLTLAPNHAPGLTLRGMIEVSLEQPNAARESFSHAVKLDSGQKEAHDGLGSLLMATGELPAAAAHFRQALNLRLNAPLQHIDPEARPNFAQISHLDLLWQTLAQLAEAGTHAFAFAGTLLGLVREGHLLPFDKDLDFGLPFNEMPQACACLTAHGWQEVPRRLRLENPRSFKHLATGVVVDLCGLLDQGHCLIGGFWQEGAPAHWQRITEFPAPLTLHHITSPSGKVWSLTQPEAWLTAFYGDWRSPEPDFDTVIAAYNLRGFSLLTECFALDRINHFWREGDLMKVLSLLQHTLRRLPEDHLLQQAQQRVATFLAQHHEAATQP